MVRLHVAALGFVLAGGCTKTEPKPAQPDVTPPTAAPEAEAEAEATPEPEAKADAPATGIAVGDQAPDFEVKDEAGNTVKLSEHRGKQAVLLAFYPKDFTGG